MSVAILGLVTSVAYGVAYDSSYGVLIDPIRARGFSDVKRLARRVPEPPRHRTSHAPRS